jgi:hypothetical protein
MRSVVGGQPVVSMWMEFDFYHNLNLNLGAEDAVARLLSENTERTSLDLDTFRTANPAVWCRGSIAVSWSAPPLGRPRQEKPQKTPKTEDGHYVEMS